MNFLITGGCGFIGSSFINQYFYTNPNSTIINIDAMYYCANEFNILPEIQSSKRYKLIKANIRSMDILLYILNEYNITHVIHFAAQSHVQNSFELSLEYTKDNILGTHILLEACRQWNRLKLFIHVSTDEVYGESSLETEEKMCEESIMCPTNPYAATKAGAELIAKSYYHSFKMPIIITRGNNVYGPNQYPEKLIPLFIKLLKNGDPVTIHGTGESIRSFLYIDDVIRAFELIIEKGKIGEIYNIGGDEHHEYSVLQIAEKLIKLIHGETVDWRKWIVFVQDRPFNDKRYFISNGKLKTLGWRPNVILDDGLIKMTH